MQQSKYYLGKEQRQPRIIKYEPDGLIYSYDFNKAKWIEDINLCQIFLGRMEVETITKEQANQWILNHPIN